MLYSLNIQYELIIYTSKSLNVTKINIISSRIYETYAEQIFYSVKNSVIHLCPGSNFEEEISRMLNRDLDTSSLTTTNIFLTGPRS